MPQSGGRPGRGPGRPPVHDASVASNLTPHRRLDVSISVVDEPTPPPPPQDMMVTVPQAHSTAEEDEDHAATEAETAAESENIIVRFPREQVEELVTYLISELMEQGMTEDEASEKAAELLDDPESQLVMARELHKPVLSRILQQFYEVHDPDALAELEKEVNAFTGHTEDLLMVLEQRYRFNDEALGALRGLSRVVDEENEWLMVAERSATGASSRLSSATSSSARRFLIHFFTRHDESRVLEVNNIVDAYQGATADLRRVLSDEYANNKRALSELAKLRVEPPEISNGKDQWQTANARLARKKRKGGLSGAVDAVGLSSAWRYYVAFWLVVGAVFLLFYSVHLMLTMLLAMFLPEEGRWQSVGLLCCFVPSIFLLGALLAHQKKVVLSWIFVTPGEYYGDEAFSAVDTQPAHLRALLPPAVKRTFLRLPTRVVGRTVYMAALQCVLFVFPLLYSAVRTVSEGLSVLNMFSLFSQWCTAAGCCVLMALWGFGWCYAVAKKVRRVRYAMLKTTPVWWRQTALLREFGLDVASMGRAILILFLTVLVVIIPFWVNTRNETDIPLPWVVICSAIVVAVLTLREVWNSSRPEYAPLYALLLLAAFVVVGFVGTAHTSGASVGLFTTILILSQGMLLQHRHDEVCIGMGLAVLRYVLVFDVWGVFFIMLISD